MDRISILTQTMSKTFDLYGEAVDGSTGANPFALQSAGVAGLWGSAYGAPMRGR